MKDFAPYSMAAELCNGKINAKLTHWLFRGTRARFLFLSDPTRCRLLRIVIMLSLPL